MALGTMSSRTDQVLLRSRPMPGSSIIEDGGAIPFPAMKSAIRECVLVLTAFAVLAETALARSYLNCLTKKVVIVDAPNRSTSTRIQENFGFWIDEATKTVALADGKKLTIRRLDDRWISA